MGEVVLLSRFLYFLHFLYTDNKHDLLLTSKDSLIVMSLFLPHKTGMKDVSLQK